MNMSGEMKSGKRCISVSSDAISSCDAQPSVRRTHSQNSKGTSPPSTEQTTTKSRRQRDKKEPSEKKGFIAIKTPEKNGNKDGSFPNSV
jgi:hypothetical protein